MLQSALELVSGESLSPTQCTVGNFVQLSGVIQTCLLAFINGVHAYLSLKEITVTQYWDSRFSAAQTCGRAQGILFDPDESGMLGDLF